MHQLASTCTVDHLSSNGWDPEAQPQGEVRLGPPSCGATPALRRCSGCNHQGQRESADSGTENTEFPGAQQPFREAQTERGG